MKLNVETGKFWSLKDTFNYKNHRVIKKKSSVGVFLFETSFLLEIMHGNKIKHVIPIKFVSSNFPMGIYTSLGPDNCHIHFSDQDILKVC
jgi:hypothetical protein